MYAETNRRRIIVIGIIVLLVVALVGLVVGILFMGKPLGFQYANAEKQTKAVASAQEDAMKAVTAYYDANIEGKNTDEAKGKMNSSAEALEKAIKKLEGEAAIKRDEDVKKQFESFKEHGDTLVKQVKDVVATIDKTAEIRKACTSEVFTKMAEAENREDGWKVFEPCSKVAEKFNPNELPDVDYKLNFITMKKTIKDTKEYLTKDESLYDDVSMRLATLGVTAEQTDLDVQARIRETLNLASTKQLDALLVSKQEDK